METIKPGTKQARWTTTVTCSGNGNRGGGCGAELRVSQGDLFTTESHARDETTRYVTTKCQECGVLTDLCELPSTLIPADIVRGLPTQRAWIAATT